MAGLVAGLPFLSLLAFACPQAAVAGHAGNGWESPFQAGRPHLVRDRLRQVPSGRCDRDQYNKCTFTAQVDYDGDGRMDTIRMVDSRRVSALVVEFARASRKRPLTIASFRGPWTGGCYIEANQDDRTAVTFICPEASMAIYKMRNGAPAVRWIGD